MELAFLPPHNSLHAGKVTLQWRSICILSSGAVYHSMEYKRRCVLHWPLHGNNIVCSSGPCKASDESLCLEWSHVAGLPRIIITLPLSSLITVKTTVSYEAQQSCWNVFFIFVLILSGFHHHLNWMLSSPALFTTVSVIPYIVLLSLNQRAQQHKAAGAIPYLFLLLLLQWPLDLPDEMLDLSLQLVVCTLLFY
jgi:hypothetical protein